MVELLKLCFWFQNGKWYLIALHNATLATLQCTVRRIDAYCLEVQMTQSSSYNLGLDYFVQQFQHNH